MKLTVSLKGDKELIARLSKMSEVVQASLYQKMQTLTLMVEALVKKKLSGPVLKVGTNRPGHTGGQLRSSIDRKIEMTGIAVYGTVFSSGDVKYAAIHEFGGKTSAHLIIAKRASVLAYTKNGDQRFARYVHHPGSAIPERSYMRSSLKDLSNEITLGLKAAVVQAIQKQVSP